MKRGAGGEENGKKLNSTTNEPKEDTTHVVYEDPFVDQYEEEEFVEDNEEDEDKVEELNGEEEETERHDVSFPMSCITIRYSKSERTRWRRESAWSTITAPTTCTTA